MASLTQEQINLMKSKGLTDEKIAALASKNGYSMPKQSTLSKVGNALIKSEKNFGQSIAAASSGVLSGTKKNLDLANQMATETQNAVLKRIKEKQAKGEDVSRLLGALKTMDKEINFYDVINESTNNSINKTGRQVFGEGLGVATDILGAGALPGGVGQVAKATSFGKGVVQGAKTAALAGGIFGTAQGISRSAQENKTGGEILGSGIRGGIEGVLAGGVVGGTIGGVAGGIAGRQERAINKNLDYTLDLVSPRVTRKVAEQAGMEGRVTAPGYFKKVKITPSRRDIALADAVSDYVSPQKTVVENVDSIKAGVADINRGVKGMLIDRADEEIVPIKEALLPRLQAAKGDLKLIFASDKTAEKTFDAVAEEFMKYVKDGSPVKVFEARQVFDKIPAIKKLLESQALGENSRKVIVSEIRDAANQYVSSLLPANNPYRYLLLQESKMIEALGNMVSKNASTIGTNKIQALLTDYPWMKYLLYGVGTGVAMGVVSKVTGLGGSQR